jgi:hypothetical protein
MTFSPIKGSTIQNYSNNMAMTLLLTHASMKYYLFTLFNITQSKVNGERP